MEPTQDTHDRRLPAPVEEHPHLEGLRDIVEWRIRLTGREPPQLLQPRVLEVPPVELSVAVQLLDRMIVFTVPHRDRLTGGHHGPGHTRWLGLVGQVPVVQMGREAARGGQPASVARELQGIHVPVVREGPEQPAVGEVPQAHRVIIAGARSCFRFRVKRSPLIRPVWDSSGSNRSRCPGSSQRWRTWGPPLAARARPSGDMRQRTRRLDPRDEGRRGSGLQVPGREVALGREPMEEACIGREGHVLRSYAVMKDCTADWRCRL